MGDYVFVFHSKPDLATVTPRQRWKEWYRAQRLAAKGITEPPLVGEIGYLQGVRFIESE